MEGHQPSKLAGKFLCFGIGQALEDFFNAGLEFNPSEHFVLDGPNGFKQRHCSAFLNVSEKESTEGWRSNHRCSEVLYDVCCQ